MVQLTTDGGVVGAFARAYALLGPTIAMRDGERWLEVARFEPDEHWAPVNGAPKLHDPTFYRGLGSDLKVALVSEDGREHGLEVSSLELRPHRQTQALYQGLGNGRRALLAKLELESGLWVDDSGDFAAVSFSAVVVGDLALQEARPLVANPGAEPRQRLSVLASQA